MTRGQDSRLALGRLGALVEQLETLVRGGREIILVTSGTSCLQGGGGEGTTSMCMFQLANPVPVLLHLHLPNHSGGELSTGGVSVKEAEADSSCVVIDYSWIE